MPFMKIPGTDKYRSESGKTYTKKQMKLYYEREVSSKVSRKAKLRKPK